MFSYVQVRSVASVRFTCAFRLKLLIVWIEHFKFQKCRKFLPFSLLCKALSKRWEYEKLFYDERRHLKTATAFMHMFSLEIQQIVLNHSPRNQRRKVHWKLQESSESFHNFRINFDHISVSFTDTNLIWPIKSVERKFFPKLSRQKIWKTLVSIPPTMGQNTEKSTKSYNAWGW